MGFKFMNEVEENWQGSQTLFFFSACFILLVALGTEISLYNPIKAQLFGIRTRDLVVLSQYNLIRG
jgi:hypothetical protein